MKPLAEQDHYEILEVGREATAEEIERCYRLAQVTWAEGSLATYAVIGVADAGLLRERVEAAYRVLSDAEARAAYDAWLGEQQQAEADEPPAPPPEAPAAEEAPPDEPLDGVDPATEVDGGVLRRRRLLRGIELDEISEKTKINPLYLRFLEEERFGDLPAEVYVRGFVSAYASCLGLDPQHVAASYMRRYREERGAREARRARR